MYECRILADSRAPCGERLTTFLVTYPRFVHEEGMTHRDLSRNTSSSRAAPIEKVIEQVRHDPVVPVYWGAKQKGMVAERELTPEGQRSAQDTWLAARLAAIDRATDLLKVGAHKQLVNRLLMPWCWITVIYSATAWENFFALRTAPDAQPEFREVALRMCAWYYASEPRQLASGEAHLPLVSAAERAAHAPRDCVKMCVARCARVSYLRHEVVTTLAEDIARHDALIAAGHMSPLEHAAFALSSPRRSGNFVGFEQYRKTIKGERRAFSVDDARRVLADRGGLGAFGLAGDPAPVAVDGAGS